MANKYIMIYVCCVLFVCCGVCGLYYTIVAVADEARLSCSIFIVYRLLTSVTHAPI